MANAMILPDELLGKVFAAMDEKERCRVIPLVCRRFLRVHKEYPSRLKTMAIDARSVDHSFVTWFINNAMNLEDMEIYVGQLPTPTFLSQMLALAAVCAPSLRCLRFLNFGEDCDMALHSVALLTCLTRLEVEGLEFVDEDDRAPFSCLSSLTSLKEVVLSHVDAWSATEVQADMLWNALACLTSLTTLHFTPLSGIDGCERWFVLQSLPRVHQIRELHLQAGRKSLVDGGELPATLSTLTRLTALTLGGPLPITAFRPITGLPLLVSLDITLAIVAGQVWPTNTASLALTSRHLTSLAVRGGNCSTVDALLALLPPSIPGLPTLHSLVLDSMRLQSFPVVLADRFQHLTMLKLRRNCHSRLPEALAQIPSLRHLSLKFNPELQLDKPDLKTLSSLGVLSCLDLTKCPGHVRYTAPTQKHWSALSTATLFSLARLQPGLEVKL